jgi:hypothetical protein
MAAQADMVAPVQTARLMDLAEMAVPEPKAELPLRAL